MIVCENMPETMKTHTSLGHQFFVVIPDSIRDPGNLKATRTWIPAIRQAHGPEFIEGLSPE